MPLTAINDIVITTKGLFVDVYNILEDKHIIFDIPVDIKVQEKDYISNVAIASHGQYLALSTCYSKRLFIYDSTYKLFKCFALPRAANRIRFTVNSAQIIVADKTGDVFSYELKDETNEPSKLLGHLSVLLDVLHSNDEKFIITADRDEKIRVTNYPNTYNINTYCLGHTEFVNHIEFLPHDNNYLVSTSGDGTIKIWDYVCGKLCYDINVCEEIKDDVICRAFVESMDKEAIEVKNLPIVHFVCSCLSETQSILVVTLFNIRKILVYIIEALENNFTHKLQQTIMLNASPSAIFLNRSLFVHVESESNFDVYELKNNNSIQYTLLKKVKVFNNKVIDSNVDTEYDKIKLLYKKKYDNVIEYQERKRQRLNTSGNKV